VAVNSTGAAPSRDTRARLGMIQVVSVTGTCTWNVIVTGTVLVTVPDQWMPPVSFTGPFQIGSMATLPST